MEHTTPNVSSRSVLSIWREIGDRLVLRLSTFENSYFYLLLYLPEFGFQGVRKDSLEKKRFLVIEDIYFLIPIRAGYVQVKVVSQS